MSVSRIAFFFFRSFLRFSLFFPHPIFRWRLEALRNDGGKREKLQQNRLISRINKSFIGN